MKKEILTITKEGSEYELIATGNPDDIMRALTEYLVKHSARGDRTALDILFSVTVHYLSMGGRTFAQEYVSNLKEHIDIEKKSIAITIKNNQKQSS